MDDYKIKWTFINKEGNDIYITIPKDSKATGLKIDGSTIFVGTKYKDYTCALIERTKNS